MVVSKLSFQIREERSLTAAVVELFAFVFCCGKRLLGCWEENEKDLLGNLGA